MGATVLVVDDDPATVEMLCEALEDAGYRALRAAGDAGVGIARAARPDVILLDVNMPGLGGPGVARALRADPATARIPIMAMSAGATPPDMPADARLTKPFALAALVALVARLASPAG